MDWKKPDILDETVQQLSFESCLELCNQELFLRKQNAV